MPENSPVGEILIYNRTTNQLIFKATDADEGVNGSSTNGIVKNWRLNIYPATIILTTKIIDESYNSVFELNQDTGEVTLARALDRSVASSYEVSLDNFWKLT